MDKGIIITIYRNLKPYEGKKVSISATTSLKKLLTICSEILNIQAKRIFKADGVEVEEIMEISPEDNLYISEGEDFHHSKNKNNDSEKTHTIRNTMPGIPVQEQYSVAIMGPAAVGKSCITLRYVLREFVNEYNNTLEDKFTKFDNIDGKMCKVEILDTSGEDEFIPLRTLWIKAREGFLFVYSVTNKKTMEDLDHFYRLFSMTYPNKDVPLILVANKIDLAQSREVSTEEGMALAARYGAEYFEISAKTGYNVDNAYACLIRKLRKKREAKNPVQTPKPNPEKSSIWDWCTLI